MAPSGSVAAASVVLDIPSKGPCPRAPPRSRSRCMDERAAVCGRTIGMSAGVPIRHHVARP
eukprot:1316045-Prymnesium_polylepis.4